MVSLDLRILNRCSGYWPHSPLADVAVKAWAHLLADLDADAVLSAIDRYAAEGHVRPPLAGQVFALVRAEEPWQVQDCRRRRANALRRVREGAMTQSAFDELERTVFSRVLGGDT